MENIRRLLKENNVKFKESNGWIIVHPKDKEGFEVSYSEDEMFAYVGCSGWHEEFDDKEEAKNCFMNALTPHVRLQVSLKGQFEYKWKYEARFEETWEDFGITALLFIPFWRKTKIVIKVNKHIDR